MELTPSNLAAMFTAYDVRWRAAYSTTPVIWDRFGSLAPSGTTQNTYAWMAKIPVLRKWLGERQAQNVQSYSYTIVNDDYELTMELERNVIEDDQYGIYNPVVDDMGMQSRKWPDYLMFDLLRAGDGNLTGTSMTAAQTLCFDGLTMFNAAHPYDSVKGASAGSYSNYNTAYDLTPDNYGAARAQFATFKGEDQKPLGVIPDLMIVPPALEPAARQLLQSDFNAFSTLQSHTAVGSASNIWKNTCDLLVVPELQDRPKEWYLVVTKRAIKPFVHQLRKAPEFVYFNQPNSEPVFNRRKFVYGVHARGAAGYTLPFLAMKCITP